MTTSISQLNREFNLSFVDLTEGINDSKLIKIETNFVLSEREDLDLFVIHVTDSEGHEESYIVDLEPTFIRNTGTVKVHSASDRFHFEFTGKTELLPSVVLVKVLGL